MRTVRMSRAGLEVSELCFGTLTLGTLQVNLSPHEGAKAIRRALELGVTFFDTAQRYGSYPHLREELAGLIRLLWPPNHMNPRMKLCRTLWKRRSGR